jgi:hypothetical protein
VACASALAAPLFGLFARQVQGDQITAAVEFGRRYASHGLLDLVVDENNSSHATN